MYHRKKHFNYFVNLLGIPTTSDERNIWKINESGRLRNPPDPNEIEVREGFNKLQWKPDPDHQGFLKESRLMHWGYKKYLREHERTRRGNSPF